MIGWLRSLSARRSGSGTRSGVHRLHPLLLTGLLLAVPALLTLAPPVAGDAAEPEVESEAEVDAQPEPAKPLDEPPADAVRLGDELCLECHAEFGEEWDTLRHNQYMRSPKVPAEHQGCEGCHGPGSAHLEDPDFGAILNPADHTDLKAAQACLVCHGTDIRAGRWLATPHARAGKGCGDCHESHVTAPGPYQLREETVTELCLSCHPAQEGDFHMESHHPVLEERMECTDCHDPHEADLATESLLKSGDDLCLKCHLDKRGPFIFEHQTALDEDEDSCLTCHRAHGSPNRNLQQYFGRATCLQCHQDIHFDPAHRTRPQECWTAGCHSAFHGSNVNRLFLR